MTPEEKRKRAVEACTTFVNEKMHEVEGRARLMIALCPPPHFICRFTDVGEATFGITAEYRGGLSL